MNAKEEILEHIGNKEVERIKIAYRAYWNKPHVLIEGGADVIDQLDFEYYDGYGRQELYGYIWYKDGTWSEREEYDGSEWWEHKERPAFDVKVESC